MLKDRIGFCQVALLILSSLCPVFGNAEPDYYLTQRYLGGLKINISEELIFTGWSAIYFGNGYYPTRDLDRPGLYQGYDIVPGFLVGLGKVIGETKLSVGADYYYLWRNWELNNDQPSIRQNRVRANFVLSIPFCGNFNLTVIQRFERITQKKFERKRDANGKRYGDFVWDDDALVYSWMRSRMAYKLTSPAYSPYKIAAYTSYEGFLTTIASPDNSYYVEAELGISFNPIKGFSITLADQIQKLPQTDIPSNHQITCNLFYTLDLSKQIAKMKQE